MTIQINLVPENLRKKRKLGFSPLQGFRLPREVVIGLVGGLIGLLVFVHLLLQGAITVQWVRKLRYEGVKKQLAIKKTDAERVVQELRRLQGTLGMFDNLINNNRRVYWAPKLNAISDDMTRGVWLERLAVEGKKMTLSGSAVSKTAAEMIEINNFFTKLKADIIFNKDFIRVELGTVKTRKVNTTPVADFAVTATLK